MAFYKGRSFLSLLTKPALLSERIYDKSVDVTLKFYESWIIPKGQTISLRDLKLKEFNDRRKLLNPY